MTQFNEYLTKLCQEIIVVLQWLCSSERQDLHLFSKLTEKLKADFIEMHRIGKENFQPGGLDEITTLESIVESKNNLESHDLGNLLLKSVLNCFKESWCGPVLITLHIEICKVHLKKIKQYGRLGFSTICKKFFDAIFFIVSYYKNEGAIVSVKTSTVLMCLHQIQHILPLLLTSIEKDCHHVRRYVVNCLLECLERIQRESCEESQLSCSEFLELMDSGLNLLDDIANNPFTYLASDGDNVKVLKTLIDDVLCHAMSIAHVAVHDDDKSNIISLSQMILKRMECLKDNLTGEDVSDVCLSANEVSDGLCALERTVNVAVLNLVVYVTAQDPLKKLVSACSPSILEAEETAVSSSSRGLHRQASDLDSLIMEFDAHMDRLIQIGTFAISCSANPKKVMQLRSCLASFEALEAEVVPSVTALYLDVTNEHKRNLRLFIEQWQQVSAMFQAILETIVDPLAYTEVVKDYVKECTKELMRADENHASGIIVMIVKTVRALDGVTKASICQDFTEDPTVLTDLAQQMVKAANHCEHQGHKLKFGTVTLEKVMPSVRALELVIARLVDYQAGQIAGRQLSDTFASKYPERYTPALLPQKSYYKLCPAEMEISSVSHLGPLTPHLAKGRSLLKEALLYRTPKRPEVKGATLETPAVSSTVKKDRGASVARSRCFRSSVPVADREARDLSDMELTALLEAQTHLDSTFSLQDLFVSRKSAELKGRRLLHLFSDWESLLDETQHLRETENETVNSVQPGSTLNSNGVETPQRVNDLRVVEEKIESLKFLKQMEC